MSTEEGMPRVFWELHEGLPRQGPGNNESTRRAFQALGPLVAEPRIVDVGCGPGMQTLELARLTNSRIIAIDNHRPFLEELDARAREQGLPHLVETRADDMADLGFEPASVDLFWSEGAIYIVGFERGLRAWRPMLRDGGQVVVSETTWLEAGAPDEVVRFWAEGYPGMRDASENARIAESCGYRVLDQFPLPVEAWWTDYYDPLVARLPVLEQKYADDREALAVLAEEAREIELFRRYSDYYGYVFYVLQRDSGT